MAGVLEVFGLCFFAVVFLLHTAFPPGFRILMMNGVFVIPLMWQIYKYRSCRDEGAWKQLSMFILALILEIGGIALFISQVRGFGIDMLMFNISWRVVQYTQTDMVCKCKP